MGVTVGVADRSTLRRSLSGRSFRADSSARTGGRRIRKPARASATPGRSGRRWASFRAARPCRAHRPSSRSACRGSVPARHPRSRRRARPHNPDRLGEESGRTLDRIEASLPHLPLPRSPCCPLLLGRPHRPHRSSRQRLRRQRRHPECRGCPHRRRRSRHPHRLLRRPRPGPLLRRFRTWGHCYTPTRTGQRRVASPESASPASDNDTSMPAEAAKGDEAFSTQTSELRSRESATRQAQRAAGCRSMRGDHAPRRIR